MLNTVFFFFWMQEWLKPVCLRSTGLHTHEMKWQLYEYSKLNRKSNPNHQRCSSVIRALQWQCRLVEISHFCRYLIVVSRHIMPSLKLCWHRLGWDGEGIDSAVDWITELRHGGTSVLGRLEGTASIKASVKGPALWDCELDFTFL